MLITTSEIEEEINGSTFSSGVTGASMASVSNSASGVFSEEQPMMPTVIKPMNTLNTFLLDLKFIFAP